MAYEVPYHPDRWTRTKAGVAGQVMDVDQQQIWQETGDGEWMHVTVQRLATGRSRPVYVAEAFLRRDLQPNGTWRSVHHFEPTKIRLIADSDAPASAAPKPQALPEHAAQHLARTRYAVPGSQDEPETPLVSTRYTLRVG